MSWRRCNKSFSVQCKSIYNFGFCNFTKGFRSLASDKFKGNKPAHLLRTSHELVSRRATLPCWNEIKIEGLFFLKEVLKKDYSWKIDLTDVYFSVKTLKNSKGFVGKGYISLCAYALSWGKHQSVSLNW